MSGAKKPFRIDVVIRRLRRTVAPFPPAALFELAGDGFTAPFEQLVACILSIRTRDEVMLPTARALFATARSPVAIAALPDEALDDVIRACTFYRTKARQIRAIARDVAENHGGQLPCERTAMLRFSGVGPKCANLVLGIACGQPHIGVDVHVHRVTNRWGYVAAANPEATMAALEAKLPQRYWIEINRLLVPFGKHLCTGRRPACSTCPLLEMCAQVGVGSAC